MKVLKCAIQTSLAQANS